MRHTAELILIGLALIVGACALRIGSRADLAPVDLRAAALPPANWTEPWFCHDLDCPPYTVVKTHPTYEKRVYAPGVWVSTDVEAYFYLHAAVQGFRRLFHYTDGGNDQDRKLPMTAPVAVRIPTTTAGLFCKSNFTVSFYVPFKYQDKTPEPSDPAVKIKHTPSFIAYVGQSGGLVIDDWTISKLAKSVVDALKAEGKEEQIITDFFFHAGYDPPFRLTGRHSEAWIVSTEEPLAAVADAVV